MKYKQQNKKIFFLEKKKSNKNCIKQELHPKIPHPLLWIGLG